MTSRLQEHLGAPYPSAGTLLVHPEPARLLELPDDTSNPGMNRFDDPTGRVKAALTRLFAEFSTLGSLGPSSYVRFMVDEYTGAEDRLRLASQALGAVGELRRSIGL